MESFVTLVTNDGYTMGAIVLGKSIKKTETTKQISCMITQGVSDRSRHLLATVFDHVISVDEIDSKDEIRLKMLKRPELGITFTKFRVWQLTQFKKVVFLDADTLVLKNVDGLFDYPELSAAPDVGWPDCFNSGVFVCVPDLNTFDNLVELAIEKGSFDGGDQGLLNRYFSDWFMRPECRLSFTFNVVSSSFYSYRPAYQEYRNNIKIYHFIGPIKPWTSRGETSSQDLSQEMRNIWWSFFEELFPSNREESSMASSFYSSSALAYTTTSTYEPPKFHPAPHDLPPVAGYFSSYPQPHPPAFKSDYESERSSSTSLPNFVSPYSHDSPTFQEVPFTPRPEIVSAFEKYKVSWNDAFKETIEKIQVKEMKEEIKGQLSDLENLEVKEEREHIEAVIEDVEKKLKKVIRIIF